MAASHAAVRSSGAVRDVETMLLQMGVLLAAATSRPCCFVRPCATGTDSLDHALLARRIRSRPCYKISTPVPPLRCGSICFQPTLQYALLAMFTATLLHRMRYEMPQLNLRPQGRASYLSAACSPGKEAVARFCWRRVVSLSDAFPYRNVCASVVRFALWEAACAWGRAPGTL